MNERSAEARIGVVCGFSNISKLLFILPSQVDEIDHEV